MNETIETTAVVVQRDMPVSQALKVDEIVDQVRLIQEVMHKVMKDKVHYGTIPGCGDKKTLLQPGAQTLCLTFRIAPSYEIQEVNLERGHKEYRVLCTLKAIQTDRFVGQGVGACSTMESKYRWRGGFRKCPKCGKEGTIIKGKREYGGGWLCFGKKDGCGEKWPDGAPEIEGQSVAKVENDNPADCYNTVLKIAKKRAFVDATITATAASDIFTQDIGDDEPSHGSPPEDETSFENAGNASQSVSGVSTPQPPAKSLPEVKPEAPKATLATAKTRMWALNLLTGAPGQRNEGLVERFLRTAKWIPHNGSVIDWDLAKVPTTKQAVAELVANIQNFEMQESQPQETQ